MPRSSQRPTRVFFAADIHGSEPAFRKFVNAASFYGVDALVFGGDIMGKAMVPVVRTGDGSYTARLDGRDQTFDEEGRARFERSAEQQGFYHAVMDQDEYVALRDDPLARTGLFHELARTRLQAWLDIAEERLAGTGVRMYLTGGNDDEPAVLEVLDRHEGVNVVACEGRLIELDGEHTMITVGLSTVTPWDTPREAGEDQIADAIDAEVAKVPDLSRCVFNFHCPPKDTPIDTCLKLEWRPGEDLPQPIRQGGRFLTTGGGSQAVRDAVKRYQPLVGVHGHIHESGGRFRLGTTQTFNPGSEYVQGSLQGWILGLQGTKLRGYQHTSG